MNLYSVLTETSCLAKSRMRNSLAHLFYVDDKDGRNKRLRELLVDLRAPLFHNDVPPQAKKLLGKFIAEARPAVKPGSASKTEKKEPVTLGLNQVQISAQDYALVLGTRKTMVTDFNASTSTSRENTHSLRAQTIEQYWKDG